MNIKNLLPIVGVLVFFACIKDPIPPEPTTIVMPPLTHQGINTFGCYINFPSAGASGEQGGELFVANDGDSYWDFPPISGSFDESTKKLTIQGTRYSDGDKREFIVFVVNITAGISSYSLQVNSTDFEGYRINGVTGACDYFHDPENKGTCEITYLDMTKNIIAGRFQMTLINPDCEGDSLLQITDGRFDFKY
jgi:hypothetical protein